VYSGAVAGQAYQTNGGGANYLCMSNQPTYLNFTAGTQGWLSQLFRTEYKTINAQLNATYNSLHNFEMPCAVCQSQPTRMYSFVQHGNTNCPAGFFTDFMCVLRVFVHPYLPLLITTVCVCVCVCVCLCMYVCVCVILFFFVCLFVG
jgi:hypothetical protein